MVDFLVRRKRKDILAELWKGISEIMNSEFKPQSASETFKWYCKEGKQIDVFYNSPQSWKQLEDLSFKKPDEPRTLINNPFALYFLLCYPHRLNPNTAKFIDK